jgi:pipecolate-incorporating enzyme
VEVLRRAVALVVARHEALRTRYVAAEGGIVQQIDPPPPTPLAITDLRHLEVREAADEARRFFIADARRPFDLAKEVGARWTLLRIGDRSNRLVLTVHQIGCGPIDVATILVTELVAIYDAYVLGETPALPEQRLQFADYSSWLSTWLTGAGAPMVERWRARFADARPLEIPTDRPRTSPVSIDAETVQFELPRNIVEPLDVLCRERRVPPTVIFLSALAVSLAKQAKQSDAVVGLLLDTHTLRPELASIIGRFLNPVPCRLDLSGDPTGVQLLSRARVSIVESHRNRMVPSEFVVDHPSPLDSPLMRVMMNIISQPPLRAPPCFRGTETFEWYETDECKTELVLSAHRLAPDLWSGYLRARQSNYDRARVESMVADFIHCITALVLTPDAKVGISTSAPVGER